MIKIGTSGYSYPHWQATFYPPDLPAKKWFSFYAQNFKTVELNVTFYRLPQPQTFQHWFKLAPQDFLFSLKGSRFITHVKKLHQVSEPLLLFWQRAQLLKHKLGVILWQFPSSFKLDLERLARFLELQKKQNIHCRQAFEFRHPSWFCQEVYDFFKKYNLALVIADSPYFPKTEELTADFVYLRFHGGKELYGSNYSQQELVFWAKKIKKWEEQNLDIYAYFNNDVHGYAIKNAQLLINLLK